LKSTLKSLYVAVKQQLLQIRLRYVDVLDSRGIGSVLIIAPHPDDEILGLGGMLSRCRLTGIRVTLVYLTDGESSHADLLPDIIAGQRIALSNKVLSCLGMTPDRVFRLHLPDGRIPRRGADGYQEAKQKIARWMEASKPDAVFVTHPEETWPYDHVAASEMTLDAVSVCGLKSAIYGYWVWVWYSMPLHCMTKIDWRNTFRIPIQAELKKKRLLVDDYLKPLAPNGKPWSGVLPAALLKAFSYPYEVVTKISAE